MHFISIVPDHGSLISPRYSKDDFISSKINSIAEEEFSSDFANNLCQTTESVDTRSTSRRSSAIARLSDKFPRLVKPNAIQSFRLRKTKTSKSEFY